MKMFGHFVRWTFGNYFEPWKIDAFHNIILVFSFIYTSTNKIHERRLRTKVTSACPLLEIIDGVYPMKYAGLGTLNMYQRLK